jgi:hypothetical protein
MSPTHATEARVRSLASDGSPAPPVDRGIGPTRILLLLASVATVGVAVWLFAVIGSVLPSRDPEHIPMWRGVAIAFLGYGGLSWAYIYAGLRSRILRMMILAFSVAAVGGGIFGIVAMARVVQRAGHPEGYIFLMGLILCGHGVTGILDAVIAGRRSRPLGTA